MTPNLIIWLLLALTAVSQMAVVAMAGENARVMAELRVRQRMSVRPGLTALVLLMGLAILALWIMYSIAVHDWRFAAITGVGVIAQYIIKFAAPRKDANS